MLFSLVDENDVMAWLLASGTGLLCYLCSRLGLRWLNGRLGRIDMETSKDWKGVLTSALSATNPLTLIYLSLYAASANLVLKPRLESLLERGFVVILVIQIGWWGNRALWWWMEQRSNKLAAQGDNTSLSSLNVFKVTGQIVLWATILLLLLDNLGFNISALVTSLGIGGVAIALAIQNILGDLFASLSIAMDKPFVVGDSIQVDTYSGTVIRIGLKTTRVQSDNGEELIFSNGDLLRSRVRNFQRMAERRVTLKFGVTYGTQPDQIPKINAIVKQAIESQDKTRFGRVHFTQFGDSRLEFEAVYFMRDQNYLCYMEAQQAINIAILSGFSAEGVDFAVPAQTINIASLPRENKTV